MAAYKIRLDNHYEPAGEPLVVWESKPFKLTLYQTGNHDFRNQEYLGYVLEHDDKVIFKGDDFSPSPMHSIDGRQSVAGILAFLSLKPGDTDREYFDDYTAEQLEWCQAHGEELSYLQMSLEEKLAEGQCRCCYTGCWQVFESEDQALDHMLASGGEHETCEDHEGNEFGLEDDNEQRSIT